MEQLFLFFLFFIKKNIYLAFLMSFSIFISIEIKKRPLLRTGGKPIRETFLTTE